MVTNVRPDTLGKGQRPHNIPLYRANEDNEDDEDKEEYPGSEGYKDEEDKGMEYASMKAEIPPPDLQVIMTIIQGLASTVVSLQIQQEGGNHRAGLQDDGPPQPSKRRRQHLTGSRLQ